MMKCERFLLLLSVIVIGVHPAMAAWTVSAPVTNATFHPSGNIGGNGTAGAANTAYSIYVVKLQGPIEILLSTGGGTSTTGGSPTWSATCEFEGEWPEMTHHVGRFRLSVPGEDNIDVPISIKA